MPSVVPIGQTVAEISRFFGFLNMAATAILDFFKSIFLQLLRSRKSKCVTVPNSVEIAQTAAKICRFFDFLQMAAAVILDF